MDGPVKRLPAAFIALVVMVAAQLPFVAEGYVGDVVGMSMQRLIQDYAPSNAMVLIVEPPRGIGDLSGSESVRVLPLPAGFNVIEGGWRLYILEGQLNGGVSMIIFYRPAAYVGEDNATYHGWTSIVGVGRASGEDLLDVVVGVEEVIRGDGWVGGSSWQYITSECALSTYTKKIGGHTVHLRVHVHLEGKMYDVHMLAVHGAIRDPEDARKVSAIIRKSLEVIVEALGLELVSSNTMLLPSHYKPLKGYNIGDEEWSSEIAKVMSSLVEAGILKGFTVEDIAEVSTLARPGAVILYDRDRGLWIDSPITSMYTEALQDFMAESLSARAVVTPSATPKPTAYTTIPTTTVAETAKSPRPLTTSITTPAPVMVTVATTAKSVEVGVMITVLVGVVSGLLAYMLVRRIATS